MRRAGAVVNKTLCENRVMKYLALIPSVFHHVQAELAEVGKQEIGGLSAQFLRGRDAGLDGDDADTVGAGGQNISGGVADQRDRCGAVDPAGAARLPDSKAGEGGARAGHLAESAEAEIIAQAGTPQLA